MYAHKRIVSVTLDIECYDDLELENLDWREVLDLQGDENVQVNIKELADIYWYVTVRGLDALNIFSVTIHELSHIFGTGQDFMYCSFKFKKVSMNYTLQQLKDRVETLIEQQGETAYCAAWIYTTDDCKIEGDNGEQEYPAADNPELSERIFNDIGNIDYIYTVIQECVDEVTEEQFMLMQQELV